jgi:hypothetical protein
MSGTSQEQNNLVVKINTAQPISCFTSCTSLDAHTIYAMMHMDVKQARTMNIDILPNVFHGDDNIEDAVPDFPVTGEGEDFPVSPDDADVGVTVGSLSQHRIPVSS